jgi:hypothetical protein
MSTPYVIMLEKCGKMQFFQSLDLSNTYVRFTATNSIAKGFLCLLFLIIHHVEVSSL